MRRLVLGIENDAMPARCALMIRVSGEEGLEISVLLCGPNKQQLMGQEMKKIKRTFIYHT